MKLTLELPNGIVEGDVVRELSSVWEDLEKSFRQRKKYDEYYYDETQVNLNMSNIKKLTEMNYIVKINSLHVTLIW